MALRQNEKSGRNALQRSDLPSDWRKGIVVRASAKGYVDVTLEDLDRIYGYPTRTFSSLTLRKQRIEERKMRLAEKERKRKYDAIIRSARGELEKLKEKERFMRWYPRYMKKLFPELPCTTLNCWIAQSPKTFSYYVDLWFQKQQQQKQQKSKPKPQYTTCKKYTKYGLINTYYTYPHQDEHYEFTLRYPMQEKCPMIFTKQPQLDTKIYAEAGVNEQNSVQKQINTTFLDQRETSQDTGMLNKQIIPSLITVSMPEEQYHIQAIMKKPLPVWNGTWKALAKNQVVKELIIPGDILTGQHLSTASMFTFFRGHPVIRVQVNGTKFHSGRLIAAFLPMASNDTYDNKVYAIDNYTSLPHVFLDAAISNSGELRLPFSHFYTYFNTIAPTRDQQLLGKLRLVVFNQLRHSDTTTSEIGVTIWAHFENCELHQPTKTHTVNLPKTAKLYAEAGVEGLVKSLGQSLTGLNIDDLTSSVGNVLGGGRNMDEPTDPQEIQRWVPNTVTSLNFGEGIDRSNRLSLLPTSFTQPSAELINTTKDDMDLLQLVQIPCNLETKSWNTSHSTGHRVFLTAVSPSFTIDLYPDKDINVDVWRPTLLGYISRAFKFWRGSLKYKIQIIASQMHTGRLLVTYSAGILDENELDTNATYNSLVIDLQERHEVEFTVPFMCERPWLRCDRLFTQAMAKDKTQVAQVGWINIYVLNKLVCPDGCSENVDVNMFVSAGEDFELAVPSDFYAMEGIGYVKAESGEETVTTRQHDDEVTLGHGTGKIAPVSHITMSENSMNLKTLLRRYTRAYHIAENEKIRLQGVYSFPNTPILSEVNKWYGSKEGIQFRTLLSHFSELFTFWRGSLRYKVIFTSLTSNVNYNIRVVHVPMSVESEFAWKMTQTGDDKRAFLDSLDNYGTMIASTRVQASVEFEIPFYTPFAQLKINDEGKATQFTCTGTVYVVLDTTNTTHAQVIDLFQAAGDDFQLNYLRAAPRLQFVKDSEKNRNDQDDGKFIYSTLPTILEAEAGDESPSFIRRVPIVGPMIQAAEDAAVVTRRMRNVTDFIDNTRQKVQDKVETFADTMVDLSNPIMTALQTALEYIKQAGTYHVFGDVTIQELLIKASNIYCGIHTWINSDSIVSKVMAIITIVTTLLHEVTSSLKAQLYTIAYKTMEFLNSGEQRHSPLRAEAFELDFIAPLVATLTTASAAIAFKKIPSDDETKKMVTEINNKLRLFNSGYLASMNIRKMWEDISQWCQAIVQLVLSFLAPHLLAQVKLHENFDDIEAWANFLDQMDYEPFEERINYDTEFKNRLERALDQAEIYRNMLIETRLSGPMIQIVMSYVKKAKEIKVKVDQAKFDTPVRKDPFCVAFYGPSGIGKSELVIPFGNAIMDELGYAQHNRWCSVNCTDQYFTRDYKHQKAIYFDDFSAMANEEQYQKFFNLKANAKYPLNMAELDKKSMCFNSDFIYMTTNIAYPRPNCINHHDALLRRRDVLIECQWNNTEEVDEARQNNTVNDLMNRDNGERNYMRFRFRDSRRDTAPTGRWMTYREILRETTALARQHLTRQERLVHDRLRDMGWVIPIMPNQMNEVEAHPPVMDQPLEAEAATMDEYFDANSPPASYDRELIPLSIQSDCILNGVLPDVWKYLQWDRQMAIFRLKEDVPDWVREEYHYLQDLCKEAGIDLQERLTRHSKLLRKSKFTIVTKGRVALQESRKLFSSLYEKIKEDHPWIHSVMKWGLYILGGLVGVAATFKLTKTIVHKCACAAVRYYGFRCGYCGKWPKWENVLEEHQDWIMEQWKTLYGNLPYQDEKVTPPSEEASLHLIKGEVPCNSPTIGTEKTYAEAYSRNVASMRMPRVMAHAYSPGQVKQLRNIRITAQGQKEEDVIYNRIFPYMYRIRTVPTRGHNSHTMNCYAIGDRNVITCKHLFAFSRDGDEFQVFHNGAWITQIYDISKITTIPNKDLIIIKLDKQFHQHKSNVNHFISENQLRYYQEGRGYLCKLRYRFELVENALEELSQIKSRREIKYQEESNGELAHCYVQDAWEYHKVTQAGDCGSVLVADAGKRLDGIIIGLHVAGGPTSSYAQLVTKEMIEAAVTRQLGTPLPPAQAKFGNLLPEGHYGRIGSCMPGLGHFQVPKSEIIKSEIHGLCGGPFSFPAVLSVNDERLLKPVNPFQDAISKYGIPARPFPPEHRRLVNEYMQDEIRRMTVLREPKPLTWDECVNGLPIEGYERLEWQTSPGWPWNKRRPSGVKGKDWLLPLLLDGNREMSDELLTAVENRERLAKRGERSISVWVDCLKDETRPLEKIQQGKTRIFTIPPVDFSILMRKYTLDFSASVKASRHDMECKVGINCHSLEWHQLYMWLAEFSTQCIAGDFSRFDGSMPPELIDDCRLDIDAFYAQYGECSEEDKKVREVLFDELIHTVHLAREELYMTHIGNKSGNPLTVIINSLVNKRYMILAWLGITSLLNKPEYHSVSSFVDNVRMAIYGDDNLLMIKEEVIDWFNQESISDYLKQYNIVYTNEQKTGITKSQTLDECSFLKQTFRDSEEFAFLKVPHMKDETIYDILNWTKVSSDPGELLEMLIDDSLRFAYFKGRKYFTNLRNLIVKAITKVNRKQLKVKLYDDYHLWFMTTLGYTFGEAKPQGEHFLLDIAHMDTTPQMATIKRIVTTPLLWILAKAIGKKKDDGRKRTNRAAIVIPSGEGKTWLCKNYPDLFVDHDDITLPELEANLAGHSRLGRLALAANSMLNPQSMDTHPDDDRILLTHHRNFTNRQILGEFILPKPNHNRNNYLNRKLIDNPMVMERQQRNEHILMLARQFLRKF